MLYLRSGNPQLALPLLQRITEVAGAHSSSHCPLLLIIIILFFFFLLLCSCAAFQTCARSPPAASGVGGGALINLGIAYKNLRRYDDALHTYAKVRYVAGG